MLDKYILIAMQLTLNNRSHKRKSINQPISFELSWVGKNRREDVHQSCEAINISSGGVKLSTSYALKRGDILKLYLPAIARSATLSVFSEVVWSKQAGSHVMAGLRFLA